VRVQATFATGATPGAAEARAEAERRSEGRRRSAVRSPQKGASGGKQTGRQTTTAATGGKAFASRMFIAACDRVAATEGPRDRGPRWRPDRLQPWAARDGLRDGSLSPSRGVARKRVFNERRACRSNPPLLRGIRSKRERARQDSNL
jgi:hypothetical protein